MRIWMPIADGLKVVGDELQADGTYTKAANDAELFTTIKTTTGDSGEWVQIDEYKNAGQGYNYYLYAYTVPIAPNETTGTLFDKIKTIDIAEGFENIIPEYQNIVVEGFAIQSDYKNSQFTYETAWDAFVRQNGYQWPDNPAGNYYQFVAYDSTSSKSESYDEQTQSITIPEMLSIDNELTFIGWKSENREIYQPNEVITVEELYVKDPNGVIANINPKLYELVESIVEGEDADSSKNIPVKLVPYDENSTAMIERDAVSFYELGQIESYNEGYSVITDTYGYTTPADSYDHWFVYGLEENCTKEKLFSEYVKVQGDGYAVVTTTAGNIAGTGSIIEVYDRRGTDTTTDDIKVEQFYIVISGDVNGTGVVDTSDLYIMQHEVLGVTGWSIDGFEEEYVPYVAKAGNVRYESYGTVNGLDLTFIIDHISKTTLLDQTMISQYQTGR